MTHLVELAIRQPHSWSAAEVHRFAPAHLHVESLVSALDERPELVDREEARDAIAEVLGDVSGVVRERLRRVLGLPTAVLVLKRLGQIPVIQRDEGLDAGRLQLVDQPAVEVEALRVRLTGAVREDAWPRD